MHMARFKYSAQVWGYVPKATKQRLLVLRKADPRRNSESQIIGDALEEYLPLVEARTAGRSLPTQEAPNRRRRRLRG
jgi:hypothetical protein